MSDKARGKADHSTNPRHPHKVATDAHGGDPMAPSVGLLERIRAALKTGKKDEVVTRWAKAFDTICPEPAPSMPHAGLLAKISEAIQSGKKDNDEANSAIDRCLHAAKQTPNWTAAITLGVF